MVTRTLILIQRITAICPHTTLEHEFQTILQFYSVNTFTDASLSVCHTVFRLFCLSFCSRALDALTELSVCTALSLDLKRSKGDLKRLRGGSSSVCLLSCCLLI